MNNKSIQICLAIGIIFLFIISAVTPMVFAYMAISKTEELVDDSFDFDRFVKHSFPEGYNPDDKDYLDILPNGYNTYIFSESGIKTKSSIKEIKEDDDESQSSTSDGPMDSLWSMYGHDSRHTGRSPYSTVDTWEQIWTFNTLGSARGGPVIADDGIIYIGSHDLDAVYPNGTLKWNYDVSGWIVSCPAIDEDGTIYVGTRGSSGKYMYAITPDGAEKWKYPTSNIFSSPAIGDDGTIYFCDSDNWNIIALYPNGTLKWAYKTGLVVYSSPAIGDDGNVYCGSHDTYLYALYPNNGTLKWKYKTGDWIRTSPCIGDDGTIYFVSLDGYLRALYPNGTLKWQTDVGAGTSPTIGQDGTIYAGYRTLHAVNPIDGSVKWRFDVGGTMRGGTPCNSIDGTIYVGTSDGGELIAINPDGTLKWRKGIGECESPPAIGEDGIVYIGSNNDRLYAFGVGELVADANGPYYGLVDKPVQFKGTSSRGYSPHSYHWDFGDTYTSDEQNPIHTYTSPGNYDVVLTVTDNEDNTAVDTTFAWIQETNTPPGAPVIDGPTTGIAGTSYDYTFTAVDPDGTNIWYYVEWGDNTNSDWIGPYTSGQELTLSHTWDERGTFTIRAKAKDPYEAEGPWGTLQVTTPRNKIVNIDLFLKLQETFPLITRILKIF